MAFLQNGTWVPDQPMQQQAQAMSANGPQMQPMMRQAEPQVMQQTAPPSVQFQPQAQMMAQHPAFQQAMQMQPQMSFNPSMMANLGLGATPQNQQPVAPVSQAGVQGGILPDGPPDPGRVQMIGKFPMMPARPQPSFQPPAAPPQSVMQNVNNANPQSVQNFLSALNQSPGASQSNAWQNAPGAQGQGPQAGFQGFQQNGSYPQQQPTQWQGYSQQQSQPQLGSYANQAYGGYNVSQQGSGGVQAGGKGGVQGQLPYNTPGAETKSPMYGQNLKAEIDNGLNAASDVNVKTNISPAEEELQDFLNNLNAYSYEYKDPKYGEGRRISPMAQEIEKSPLGAQAIHTNSEGYKIVDYGKLMGTQLAALALLNHKYNKLEQQMQASILNKLKEKGKK